MPDQWRVCNIISVRRTFLYFQMNQKSRRQVQNFVLTNMPIIKFSPRAVIAGFAKAVMFIFQLLSQQQ